MLTLTIHHEDYDHNPQPYEALVNPAHITHVAFKPETKYSDGKRMTPPRALVFIVGMIAGYEGSSSGSDCLEVRDEASIQKLRELAKA